MSKNKNKPSRVKPQLPRGFNDREAQELQEAKSLIAKIEEIYTLYGFDALETPFFEYTEALGKFLPDTDRPNAGVFSLQDDDEQWMSLRYDLTAPLARFFAQNYDRLPKPYRSYRQGYVFRNEKPGPGRFRQFIQFDADTVGTASVLADAESCMMAADTMEHLGIERGQYVVKINNRKILDAVMSLAGLDAQIQYEQRLIVLRAIDKLDRLGQNGVVALLGQGRKDASGDYTQGAGLTESQMQPILAFINAKGANNIETLANLKTIIGESAKGLEGVQELETMVQNFQTLGYDESQIVLDPAIVRGLEYYTGPVFEVELTFEVQNEKGQNVVFGSVASGGRYDGLVSRFRAQPVEATGFSIGVSRLMAALKSLKAQKGISQEPHLGPVVILNMDEQSLPAYQRLLKDLRQSGVRAEFYLGTSGMKAQMKYADKRNAPLVLIQGSDERERGEVQIKDLIAGAKLAQKIESNEEWRQGQPAQQSVAEADVVAKVQEVLAQYQ